MRNWAKAVLVVTGLVPLLGLLNRPPDTMLLITSLFALACLLRRRLAAGADRLPGPTGAWLLGFFWLSGSLTECLAWLNNRLQEAAEPALFHPQLIPDLIVGLGFYGGWAAAWWLALRRFRFTLAEAFFVTGVQGIFFEQLGAVFSRMVAAFRANPAFSLLLGVYVLAVHGSAVGLALAPILHRFDAPPRSRHWIRFPAVCALMVGLAFAGAWMIGQISLAFGGLPPKRSIVEHPLW
jgi:hypothetical protein